MKTFLSILFFTLMSFANTTIEDSDMSYRLEKIREVIKHHEKNVTKQEVLLKKIVEQEKKNKESSKNMREEYDKEYLVYRGTYTEGYRNLYIINWILEHFFLVILLFGGYLYRVYPYFGLAPDKNIKPKHLPPKGFSLLQSAIVIDKYADDKDNMSAIIELEYLGYIEISQENELNIVIKLDKSSENLTIDQRYLLDNILFSKGNKFIMNSKKRPEALEIRHSFQTLSSMLYSWTIENDYLKSKIHTVSIPFILITLPLTISLFFLLYYILLLTHGMSGSITKTIENITVVVGVIVLLWTLTNRVNVRKFILLPMFLYWLTLLGIHLLLPHDNFYRWQFWVLLLMTSIIIAIIYLSVERLGHFTPKGVEVQNHLLGLKKFIQNPDRKELETLIKEDPNYLEQMASYATLFGVWDSWLEQFKYYKVPPPKWQKNTYSLRSLKYALDNTTVLPYKSRSQY